jgi:hypothetical protein
MIDGNASGCVGSPAQGPGKVDLRSSVGGFDACGGCSQDVRDALKDPFGALITPKGPFETSTMPPKGSFKESHQTRPTLQDQRGHRWLRGQSPQGPGKVDLRSSVGGSDARGGRSQDVRDALKDSFRALNASNEPFETSTMPPKGSFKESHQTRPTLQDQREHRWLRGQSPTQPRGPAPVPL